MLGSKVTYWYKHSRHFGWLFSLDGTEVIIGSETYTPGWFLHLNEVEDVHALETLEKEKNIMDLRICADCRAEYDALSQNTGHECDPLFLAALHYCLYCDADLPAEFDPDSTPVPDADDAAAWETIAQEHQEGCEWIQTRAHRVLA